MNPRRPLVPRFVAAAGLLASALVVLVSPPAGAAPDSEPPRLTFDWPGGLVLQVRFSVQAQRTQGARDSNSNSSTSYKLTVEDADGRRVIRRDALPSPPTKLKALPVDERGHRVPYLLEVQDLIDDLGNLVPAIVVDAGGAFVAAEGLDQTIARRDLILDRAAVAPALRARLEQLITPDAAEQRAADEWKMLVEGWLGEGAAAARSERRSGFVAEFLAPIDLLVEIRHLGSVPCGDGEAADSCVALEAVSHADPEGVLAFLEESGLQDVRGLRDFTLDSRYKVVTRPRTMVPVSLEVHRRFTATYAPEAPKDALTLDERDRTWRFTIVAE